jgi:hypothetical protein
MSIRAKVISIVAAASLVAGAGLTVATPAQAKNHIKGNTKLSIDAPIISALASVGVSISTADGGSMKGRTLTFPITSVGDGFVGHRGQLQFIRDGAVFSTGANPLLKYTASGIVRSAIIEVYVPDLGATSLFTVVNFKAGKPKVKIDKKKKQRRTTTVIRGNLTVDAGQAGLINLLVGSDLLQADTPLGKTVTKIVNVAKCKNKACTR